MGWFEEQINKRIQSDDESMSNSLDNLAGVVTGMNKNQEIDRSSCAISAAQEVIRYFGYKIKQVEIPASVSNPDEQLDIILKPYGIMRRNVKLDEGWFNHAIGPMIGFLKSDGNMAALLPGRFNGYNLVDPQSGTKIHLDKKTEELLEENAICFYKSLPLKSIGWSDLISFIVKELTVTDIVLYICTLLIPVLLGLLSPMFSKWLFGQVLNSKDLRMLVSLAVFALSYLICRVLTGIFCSLVRVRTTSRQSISFRAAIMGRIMSLKPDFFADYSAGELTSIIGSLNSFCGIFIDAVGSVGLTAVFSMVYIAQIWLYAPSMAGHALAITFITSAITIADAVIRSRVNGKIYYERTKTDGMTYPMITGMHKIKVSGSEKRMFARWANQYAKEASMRYNLPAFLKIDSVIRLAVILAGSLVLSKIAIDNRINVDDYYAFMAAYGMVSSAFSLLSQMIVQFSALKPIMDIAEPILKAEPEHNADKEYVFSLDGKIEMNNVSFRYKGTDADVIKNLSLKINPGEYVAIVGKTGSGKSTIMRLLLGFESPQKGSIFYDNKDLSSLDLSSLRRRIGTVLQDGKMFLGTIYSNIVIDDPSLGKDAAWKAAEIAAIADDIRSMPMGMFTLVGEGFGGMSGGQKQRIMIARAIAPGPKVLFFDEATSALDNNTQKKISDAIAGMKCTRVVIAHRLSTVINSDRIIVLDEGAVAEAGTYDELMAAKGTFYELMNRQRIDYQE